MDFRIGKRTHTTTLLHSQQPIRGTEIPQYLVQIRGLPYYNSVWLSNPTENLLVKWEGTLPRERGKRKKKYIASMKRFNKRKAAAVIPGIKHDEVAWRASLINDADVLNIQKTLSADKIRCVIQFSLAWPHTAIVRWDSPVVPSNITVTCTCGYYRLNLKRRYTSFTVHMCKHGVKACNYIFKHGVYAAD